VDIFINEAGDAARCSIGILVIESVQNVSSEDKLMPVKQELEGMIRSKYCQATRVDLKTLHPMDSYISYYKKFGYTYHVLPQLESVIKGKPISSGLPLVEAMFMAELKNMLLTASHDLDKIEAPLSLKASTGRESFTTLSGHDVITIPNDIMIADQEGIISSILRGPDLRTAITEQTTRVIYTVYAPFGVEEQLVREHLRDIESYVRIVSEKSVTCLNQVFV
jgi:DNA/RNA-binding domain of Phe-tRNA-synthetase-like protein